jgi:hypothetical protein
MCLYNIYDKTIKKFEKQRNLICLESFNLEFNEIVKFPCFWKNSVYHIIFIEKLIY